jgi:selenocysteine lyase/cysteine desulfurase
MTIHRRELLGNMGGAAAAAALAGAMNPSAARNGKVGAGRGAASRFPCKADFNIAAGYTYINGAYIHPMPIVASEAASRNVMHRSLIGDDPEPPSKSDPKALFAALINAKPTEISYVPNTSTGENLVVTGLGIKRFDGNVVTDALHFEGALVHLQELKNQGLDLRIVPAKDCRIDMRDMEKVVDRKTKLIEVSLVAMYNGFQHDLKAVCDLAHAHGAYVYADIIQAAGAIPIDVKASGVDFCACSCFKWLMGDFGLGFLYAREELLGKVIQRSQWGYHSTADMTGHFPPLDPQADTPVSWTLRNDSTGFFEVGSMPHASADAVAASIEYIRGLGVENIHNYRQPMLRKLEKEMPRLGFVPATPPGNTAPLITFAMKNGEAVAKKLRAAKINARVSRYWMRLSPSVYNDEGDIDRLLNALS